MKLQVTVIIPVHNDADRLRLCLEALSRQTYGMGNIEVIVIDNNSAISPGPVVSEWPFARCVSETSRGSYAARNCGIAVATGEVIAFTDSDCIPEPTWVEQGVIALTAQGGVGLVAGRVKVFTRPAGETSAVELYEVLTAFPQEQYVERDKFGVTANVFTFRRVLEAVGGFDAEQQSGGDREWGRRVHAAGLRLLYAPEACVLHPARQSLGELRRKVTRVVGGLRDLSSRGVDAPAADLKWWLRQVVPPLRYLARVLAMRRLGSLRQRAGAASVLLYMRYFTLWEMFRSRSSKTTGARL
jgi:glycosyltransferase involved in cell wall biosynthesis